MSPLAPHTKVTPQQASFDDLGTPLHDVTFVVVDLETTGGSAQANAITEIGAVKVRGGQVLGEFQTLIRPSEPIPAYITMLTGITNEMVADAPVIESALPSFLEFARGSVLVAHNAGFDIGFLKAACVATGLAWPGFAVLDTVHLARQIMPRDQIRNHKLSTLAAHFGAHTQPDHRALHDARATVDVMHGLFGRVGSLGVHSLEELQSYSHRVDPQQRRKRYLADHLPSAPGVYVFKDERGRVLYVGTSVDIKRRVRQYFTSSEKRSRMGEMVRLASEVTPVVCQSGLEAAIRELRLIAEHKPRYNRRSRHPERAIWVKLTNEVYPRLSIVREVRDDGASYVGPFGSRIVAQSAIDAVHEVFALRQCSGRMPLRGTGRACALLEMGRCVGPCVGATDPAGYADLVDTVRHALEVDLGSARERVDARLAALAESERFEDAAVLRDRLISLVRACARTQRIAPLAASPQVVAATRSPVGGWEVVCIRYGRFAGTVVTPRGADPMPYIESLCRTAEVVEPPTAPSPAAYPEETEKLLNWLERPGVRLVELDGQWTCPVRGATRDRDELEPLVRAAAEVVGFDESAPAERPRTRSTATRLAG